MTESTERSALDTLDSLIGRIRALEARVCDGALQHQLISQEQLSALLLTVSDNWLRSTQSSAQPRRLRLDLSGNLQQAIDERLKSRQSNTLLSITHAAMIQATEYLFRYLEYSAGLAPDAYGVLQHLQIGVTRLLLADTTCMDRPESPERVFLETLITACRRFDCHSGPHADNLMSQISELIHTSIQAFPPYDLVYAESRQTLSELLQQANRHTLQTATNLMAKEQAGRRSDDAKQLINREILSSVEGKHLPAPFLEFLQQVWNKHLFITYLREGSDSRAWKNALNDIRIMAHGISIRNRDELFRYHSTHLSKTMTRVHEALQRMYTDDPLTREFLSLMERTQRHVMEDTPAPQVDYTTVESTRSAQEQATSNDGIQSPPLQIGNWYTLVDKNLNIRCKLIEMNSQYQYCLFVNLSGMKVARHSFGEMTQQIKMGGVRPVGSTPVLESALVSALRHMGIQLRTMERQVHLAEQQRSELKAKKIREQSEQRERQLQDKLLRQQEALLLQQEKQRQRELQEKREQTQKEAEIRAATQQDMHEQAMSKALRDIRKLQSGGWLDLQMDSGETQRCKLGLKLKSSGKLIFVDGFGRKLAQFLPDELAEKMVEGGAAIADFGVAFDDTLSGLITERSDKIHVDE